MDHPSNRIFQIVYRCHFPLANSGLYLAYLPAQPHLAEAVPGNEGDRPCITRSTLFRNPRAVCGVGMVGYPR